MPRRALILLALVVGFALAPVPARADVIQCFDALDPECVAIGEFSWLREDPLLIGFFDDRFFLENETLGEFSSLNLTLTPSQDPLLTGFATDPLGGGMTTEAINIFQGITAAQLTFLFQGTLFSVSLLETDLVFDDVTGTYFTSTLAYAETAVPEPASVLLLGSGLSAAVWLRRRRIRHD